MDWTHYLPPLNAGFNSASLILLVLAVRAIRGGDRERHRRLMLINLVIAGCFLLSYLTHMFLVGPT